MYKTYFWADFLNTTVEGWTDGSLWNGWATPHFEYPEARRVMELINEQDSMASGTYDELGDQFCFNIEGEEECYPAIYAKVEGKTTKLYAIGAWAWVWEEDEPLEIQPG